MDWFLYDNGLSVMKELSKNKFVVVKIVVCEKEIFICLCVTFVSLTSFMWSLSRMLKGFLYLPT